MENPDRQHPVSVRLEPDLSQWVKAQAKAGDRSINAQINRLIRESKEATEEKFIHKNENAPTANG